MAILSDGSIEYKLNHGDLEINPIKDDQIQPASVDLRLGKSFLKVNDTNQSKITMDKEVEYHEIIDDRIIIQPNSFVLATTHEKIYLPPYLAGRVEGRSSVGRMGVFIQNAGWIDPGFKGKITLELFNANNLPVELKALRRICQLVISEVNFVVKNPYSGKYNGQDKATASKIYLDKEVEE
ncbi:MAG: dCTP deaminase [archaeon]